MPYNRTLSEVIIPKINVKKNLKYSHLISEVDILERNLIDFQAILKKGEPTKLQVDLLQIQLDELWKRNEERQKQTVTALTDQERKDSIFLTQTLESTYKCVGLKPPTQHIGIQERKSTGFVNNPFITPQPVVQQRVPNASASPVAGGRIAAARAAFDQPPQQQAVTPRRASQAKVITPQPKVITPTPAQSQPAPQQATAVQPQPANPLSVAQNVKQQPGIKSQQVGPYVLSEAQKKQIQMEVKAKLDMESQLKAQIMELDKGLKEAPEITAEIQALKKELSDFSAKLTSGRLKGPEMYIKTIEFLNTLEATQATLIKKNQDSPDNEYSRRRLIGVILDTKKNILESAQGLKPPQPEGKPLGFSGSGKDAMVLPARPSQPVVKETPTVIPPNNARPKL